MIDKEYYLKTEECIKYMFEVVINRTFDGYTTEIRTFYGQLEGLLNTKIMPALDKWDRLYNVDFFIKIGERFIGLQIKPVSTIVHIPQIFKERTIQQATHEKFQNEFGGKVFYIFSIKDGQFKRIQNMEVVAEIKAEITRL